eukprot:Phypoly_transcript_24358.p1 GENE.Phypoly_transcript_24358~~Phypoly_transcript_24358.p1  ORF type:complete len:116 (+),score=16.11 Phypoly_transcript_24358:12-359(+)
MAVVPTQQQTYYELYRKSTIGSCLTDAIDEMISSNAINPQLGLKILLQFDKSVNETLTNKIKSKITFKGHLHTYRFCDNVWTFLLENANFRLENDQIQADKVKIVACDGRVAEPT